MQKECVITVTIFMADRVKLISANTQIEITMQRAYVKTVTLILTINTKDKKLMMLIIHDF